MDRLQVSISSNFDEKIHIWWNMPESIWSHCKPFVCHFGNFLFGLTSKFWKIVCEGEKVRARGCISSSAWYKLSFEPSTNSVRFVLFLYYKFMQQKSTNCTNSLNKKTHPNHKVTRRNVQMWLMAQMKAYTMPMKNCTLLCGPFHLRRLFSRTQMCPCLSQAFFPPM